jgi:hypothetical protein
MVKKKNAFRDNPKKSLEHNIEIIKTLLILLVNKMGVEKQTIAKAIGFSGGRISQILDPKKYGKKKKERG